MVNNNVRLDVPPSLLNSSGIKPISIFSNRKAQRQLFTGIFLTTGPPPLSKLPLSTTGALFSTPSHHTITAFTSTPPPPPSPTAAFTSTPPPPTTASFTSTPPLPTTAASSSTLIAIPLQLHTLTLPQIISSPIPTGTSPTTILQFELPSALTACSSSMIKWDYTGGLTSAELTLMVNNNVPQDAPPPLLDSSIRRLFSNPNSRRQTNIINKTLSSQIDPTWGFFLWPSVNVPQGWYQLLPILPPYGQVNQTSTFYVQEGTDTSCFITSTVIEPIEQNHTGAIVGGTVGSIAFIIGCLYMYCRRKNPRSSISCCIKEVITHLRPTHLDSVVAGHLNTPQNSENVQARENKSPRPAALALDGPPHPEQAVSSAYLRPSTSLESFNSYSTYTDPFVDGHFTPEDNSSSTEGRLSPRSSSWSFMAVSQPYTRASGAEPMPYSTQDTGSSHSTFSTPSTAPPTYKSRTSTLPPSFHSS